MHACLLLLCTQGIHTYYTEMCSQNVIEQFRIYGHYLLESCFSSEISKNGMRAGESLPLSIICIKGFLNQNLSNND